MSLLANCLQRGTRPQFGRANAHAQPVRGKRACVGYSNVVNSLSIGAMADNACARFNACARYHSQMRLDKRNTVSGLYT